MKLIDKLKKKIHLFMDKDIRWKMRSIGKILGLKIYPDTLLCIQEKPVSTFRNS